MLRAGSAGDALPHVDAALKIDPKLAYALDTRARIYEALGNFEPALRRHHARPLHRPERARVPPHLRRGEGEARRDQPRQERRHVRRRPRRSAENRIALVIGNSAYQNAADLRNAEGDARAVAEKFRDLGFRSVRLVNNMKREQLNAILDKFAERGGRSRLGRRLLRRPRHGDRRQQLADAGRRAASSGSRHSEPGGLARPCHRLGRRSQEAAPRHPRRLPRQPVRSRDPQRRQGFARASAASSRQRDARRLLRPSTARWRSTATAATAPSSTSLLKHMDTPGLEINRLFRRVADEVVNKTKRQEPFTYGRLPDEDFYFKPASDTAKAPSSISSAQTDDTRRTIEDELRFRPPFLFGRLRSFGSAQNGAGVPAGGALQQHRVTVRALLLWRWLPARRASAARHATRRSSPCRAPRWRR